MPEVPTVREEIVPFGNCVGSGENPNAIPGVFADIDTGRTVDPAAVQAAISACGNCVQLENYCGPNRDELAKALYIGGVGLVVSGGEQVQVQAPREAANELALRFDLTKIPEDPRLALNILRQGMRAGQLRMDGKKPKGAQTVANAYLDRLARTNPELHAEITSNLGEEAQIGAAYIVTAIFQQRDFGAFSAKVRTNNGAPDRYNPAKYDPETGDPVVDSVVTRYLEEALTIQRMGLSLPANKAIQYPSDYYQLLQDRYKTSAISDPMFDHIVTQNRRHPMSALRKFHARLHHARAQEPDAPESYAKTTARLNRKADFGQQVAALSTTFASVPHVTEGIIREAVTRNGSDPEQAIIKYLERVGAGINAYGEHHPIVRMTEITMIAKNVHDPDNYLATLAKFRSNVIAIIDHYGEPASDNGPDEALDDPEVFSKRLESVHEDFSESAIRRLSRAHLDDALGAAESYTERLADLREQSDGSIIDSKLRYIAAQTSESITFQEVKNRVVVQQLGDKYRARFKDHGGRVPEGSTLKRIVALYPEEEAETVADNVYTLLNQGILVPALSEMGDVRESYWQASLDKIFDPAKGRYITFNTALEQLPPEERLALAHHHNLVPLLYGADANSLVLEQSTLDGSTVEEHWQSTLAAQCTDIMQDTNSTQPLDTHFLNQDLLIFNEMLQEGNTAAPGLEATLNISNLSNVTVVVGGRVLQLAEQNEFVRTGQNIEGSMGQWIEYQVASKYPLAAELQTQALEYIHTALQNGIIEVIGSSLTEYRFVFSKAFYAETTSDLDRAVIAHETGLDRLLYGSDLGSILAERLGTEPRTVYVQRNTDALRVSDITDGIPATETQEEEAIDAVTAEERTITPFEQQQPALFKILAKVFGEEAASIAVTESRVAKLISELRNAFEANLERMGIADEQRQPIGLAWQSLLDQDMEDSLERFGIEIEDIEALVSEGLALIGDLLATTPGSKVGKLRRTLLAMPRDPLVRDEEADGGVIPIAVRATVGTSAQAILNARAERKAAMEEAARANGTEEVALARVVLRSVELGEQSFDVRGGNCERVDPDEMFVTGAAQNRAKERICGGCVLKIACQGNALAHQIEFGVWGGMTERERRAWQKTHPDIMEWAGQTIAVYEAGRASTADDTQVQDNTGASASDEQYTNRPFRA